MLFVLLLVCGTGMEPLNGTCTPCMKGYYSSNYDLEPCLECGFGESTSSSGSDGGNLCCMKKNPQISSHCQIETLLSMCRKFHNLKDVPKYEYINNFHPSIHPSASVKLFMKTSVSNLCYIHFSL